MPSIRIVQLGDGWEVQVCTVPPHASFRWQKAHISYPVKPAHPVTEITSKLDGHTESAPALPDSEEWKVWMEHMTVWQAECDKLDGDSYQQQLDFSLDYAVIGWRRIGEQEWVTDPPLDWQPRDALSRHGVELYDNPRLNFIYLELLDDPDSFRMDMNRIMSTAFPKGEQDTSPVRDEEVTAVLDKFPNRDGVSKSTGNVGTDTGTSRKWGPYGSVYGRDAGGKRKPSFARWLVQLFEGK